MTSRGGRICFGSSATSSELGTLPPGSVARNRATTIPRTARFPPPEGARPPFCSTLTESARVLPLARFRACSPALAAGLYERVGRSATLPARSASSSAKCRQIPFPFPNPSLVFVLRAEIEERPPFLHPPGHTPPSPFIRLVTSHTLSSAHPYTRRNAMTTNKCCMTIMLLAFPPSPSAGTKIPPLPTLRSPPPPQPPTT